MTGTKEGALKARETNIEKYGKDFYKKIGKKSWKNPDRDRKTGFALRSPEERKALGKKGGKTNKGKKYKKGFLKVGDTFKINGIEYKVALTEEIDFPTEVNQNDTGVSE